MQMGLKNLVHLYSKKKRKKEKEIREAELEEQ